MNVFNNVKGFMLLFKGKASNIMVADWCLQV